MSEIVSIAFHNSTIGYMVETVKTHPIISVLVFGLLLILLYNIYRIIFSLYFHPLASFPGPKLNIISNLPVTSYLYHGTAPHDLLRLHQKYGPVVRNDCEALSFTTPDAWKDIYSWAGTKKFKKANVVPPKAGVATLPTIVDDITHMRHRKFYLPAFTDRALKDQEHKIMGHVNIFIAKLRDMEGQDVDIVKWIEFLVFDIIGDLAVGEPFGCLKESTYQHWVSIIIDCMRGMAMIGVIQRFAPFDKLIYLYKRHEVRKLLKKMEEHNKMSGEKVRKRLGETDDKGRRDFWSFFLEEGNKQKGALDMEELEMILSVLIIGGSETTGSALSATTYYLLKTPETLRTLCQEIRSAFTKEEDINMASVKNLPYLHVCLQEGLRLYPPASIGLVRVAPDEGAMVAGYFVPGGTTVSIPQYAADHLECNFADAETYVPERWLSPPPERYKNDKRDVFQPFSMGPRGCLGQSLAWAEMKIVLAKMAWSFDMEFCEGSEEAWDPANQKVFIFWDKPEMKIRLKKRA